VREQQHPPPAGKRREEGGRGEESGVEEERHRRTGRGVTFGPLRTAGRNCKNIIAKRTELVYARYLPSCVLGRSFRQRSSSETEFNSLNSPPRAGEVALSRIA